MVFSEEELNSWLVEDLRKYLVARGVPLRGGVRKADLIKKVLAAELLGLSVSSSLEDKQEEVNRRRASKLTIGCIKIPFPESIASGWMKEFVYFPDLTTKYIQDYAEKSISVKGMKEGENLMNGGHVKEVQFNNISECLRYCFIRGRVVPQTRINESPYSVWVCLNVTTCEVLTGECGCIAGFSESCKHVFALLKFIADKVAKGLNKTCTSKTQVWNKTVNKSPNRIHRPARLSTVSFKRCHPEYVPDVVKLQRNTFDPRSVHDREPSRIDWSKLAAATNNTASVLCFRKPANSMDHSYSVPSSIISEADPLSMEEIASKTPRENFWRSLSENRTKKDLLKIDTLTQGQSENKKWFSFRHGVITASVAHDVLAKFKKCFSSSSSSVDNLVGKILGYTDSFKAPALSWGIEHEKYARKRYITMSRKKHKYFKCKEAGLTIHNEKFMIGASVDGSINCFCCGFGNLEIKCPFSHRDKNVIEYVSQKDSCLKVVDGQYFLKSNHCYATQMQHQMYVTGASYCDFVVYLPKESCIVRVSRYEEYGSQLVPLLESFFYEHILVELYEKRIYDIFVCKKILKEIVNEASKQVENETIMKELNQLSCPSSSK